MSKVIREQLISALSQGEFISGEQFAKQHQVSRAAVSKHIKALVEMGLDIYRVTGKGYKLAQPLVLLDSRIIQQQLTSIADNYPIEVHHLIDSTNSYLLRKTQQNLPAGYTCIAEYQTQGRGRRGRQWQSPFGANLYLSFYWPLEQGMSQAMGLSLVVAVAIKQAISPLINKPVQLKWPNDIYIEQQKIAGILIELEGQAQGLTHAVIGIGLNVQMPDVSASVIDQPWTDLARHSAQEIDRNLLAANMIKALHQRIDEYLQHGMARILKEWLASDVYYLQQVNITTGEQVVSGIHKGVNEQGALLVDIDGQLKTFYGGEVSLRGANNAIAD